LPYYITAGIVLLFFAILWPNDHGHGRAYRRSHCKNNLKQIGLALHNYHDAYGCFPPAFIADDQGRPMHSWRGLLLPFLDEGPLYNRYRFDEPWDGPNNRQLADKIRDIYTCPEEREKGAPVPPETSYLAVVGPDTAWPGSKGRALSEIKDPASETLMVVEVADSGIHWMEPRDLHVLQMAPLINSQSGQGISSRHKGGAQAMLVDGAVRFISQNLSRGTIRGLLTVRGGDVVGEF
jgi:hypothetical protein